jgi:hypothetical protein
MNTLGTFFIGLGLGTLISVIGLNLAAKSAVKAEPNVSLQSYYFGEK